MTSNVPKRPIEAFGRLMATPGASESFQHIFIFQAWMKHVANDWGDVDPEDAGLNAEAIQAMDGRRVMSVYKNQDGQKLWIITVGLGNDPTDIDMCNTVALLPSEY